MRVVYPDGRSQAPVACWNNKRRHQADARQHFCRFADLLARTQATVPTSIPYLLADTGDREKTHLLSVLALGISAACHAETYPACRAFTI